MAMPGTPKQGVISHRIPDKQTLYASYMPYVQDGGLFIPTEKAFELGDEVFVLLTLLEETERLPITGKVVWINPKAVANKPAGIGVQFGGPQSIQVQKKIETYIAGMQSAKPTYTM